MGKFKKNLENTNGFTQATYREVIELKAQISEILIKLEGIGRQVHKATFNSVMSGADISEFFPVEKNDQIEQFMDRNHPEWTSRKQEFYHFLYTIASDNKKGFARGMIKALFSRNYIMHSKWPTFGY